MNLFKYILFFLVLFTLQKANAGQGCYIGNKIYFNQTGTVTFLGSGLGVRPLFDPGASYDEFVYCADYQTFAQRTSQQTQGIFGSPISCGFTGDTYNAAVRGTVWNFDEINCPIDDYAFLMVTMIALMGGYFLRRNNLSRRMDHVIK